MGKYKKIAKERLHTIYFLHQANRNTTVHLDTYVDMSKIVSHRSETRNQLSYITYLIFVFSRIIAKYPNVNVGIKEGLFGEKIFFYPEITAKFTLDKYLNNERVVLSGTIPKSDKVSLDQIQETINYYRDTPCEEVTEFNNVRILHKLPYILGKFLFSLINCDLKKKGRLLGTFSITSVGHREIEFIHPVINSTLSIGIGRINQRPVINVSRITMVPMMGLTLSFDHRVIDGSLASDILNEIKIAIECLDI